MKCLRANTANTNKKTDCAVSAWLVSFFYVVVCNPISWECTEGPLVREAA